MTSKKEKIFFISNKKIQKDLNLDVSTKKIISRFSINKFKQNEKLAINGGKKLRLKSMPEEKYLEKMN